MTVNVGLKTQPSATGIDVTEENIGPIRRHIYDGTGREFGAIASPCLREGEALCAAHVV